MILVVILLFLHHPVHCGRPRMYKNRDLLYWVKVLPTCRIAESYCSLVCAHSLRLVVFPTAMPYMALFSFFRGSLHTRVMACSARVLGVVRYTVQLER